MNTMTLTKSDGTTEEVEIVMTFKLEEISDKNYVIYKNNGDYYGASFIVKGNITDLDTNLSFNEQEQMNKVFEKLHKGGII